MYDKAPAKGVKMTIGIEMAGTKPTKASFIGAPRNHTILYVGKKLEDRLCNLEGVTGCLVFVENGMNIPSGLNEKHAFVFCDSPVLSYARYVRDIMSKEFATEKLRQYVLTDEGYYRGEDVVLGQDVYIEPGAFIGHGVEIGDYSVVLSHAIVKHAKVGCHCLIKENAQIGGQAFTMAQDELGNEIRIPCLGSVSIDDYAEVGSFTTVCRGSNTDTTISRYAKIDDHVHVGHDVYIGDNALLTAGVVLGGYDRIGAGAYVGLNATIKQLVSVADGAQISMGSRIAKDVKSADGMYGMPAIK